MHRNRNSAGSLSAIFSVLPQINQRDGNSSLSIAMISSASRYRLPILVLTMAMVLLSACSPPPEYHQTVYVFGTLVNVDILGQTPEQAAEAVAAVEADFQRMHREWHAWKPGGELMELNRQIAAGGTLGVSPFLLPLLEQSQVLYRDSYGLYNPAIGGLISLWGFHNDEPPGGPPPPASAIEALVQARPGMDDIQIEGDIVRSRNPVVQLDFGGFAKGYALSHAIERLRGFGVDNAIVNAGGDLCVAGRHGDRPWHIGIRHPQGEGVLASIDVDDGECVMTSGNYERYREYEGMRYAHILDPRTGQPVRHLASATVIHGDGGKADAAATALTVAGPKDWERIAGRMGLRYVMLVDEEGRVYMSPAMVERVRFLEQRPQVIEIGQAPDPDISTAGPKK